MANGTLKLYNKLTNALLVSLDILGTFNIEDNLNETPSNMKVKVITSNTYREEFEVNTIAYHEDTNSWWVIKSDESTYMTTGEYEHEIQLIEYLEFYSYRHLPNCAFAPNTYTLEQMLLRLFAIAKLQVSVDYPNFLDKDKIMPFFSFENFTVANAIKNISRSINAIPKLSFSGGFNQLPIIIVFSISPPLSPITGSFWFRTDTNQLFIREVFDWFLIPDALFGTTLPTDVPDGTLFVNTATQKLLLFTKQPILTFINRNGIDEEIIEGLNQNFPIAYEKNMNSSDQFTTRSVSNITNAKSSVLVIAPKSGGLKNTIPNDIVFDETTRLGAKVLLPSKIDKIEWLNVLVPVSIMYEDEFTPPGRQVIFTGYFTNKADFENALTNSNLFGSSRPFTNADLTTAISRLPDPETFYRVNYGDVIDKNFLTNTVANKSPVFFKKMSLRSKFEFDTVSKIVGGVSEPDNDTKERTAHWLPNTNELIMPLSFRNSLDANSDHNVRYMLLGQNANGQKRLSLTTETLDGPLLRTVIKNETILIQVAYYPIADIKVSIDNDNDAQDEKYFNQSGKVIDAVSVSKLITSHTNDSVEGTKIRNAKYFGIFSYRLFTGLLIISEEPPINQDIGTYWYQPPTGQSPGRIFELVISGWQEFINPTFTQGPETPENPEQEGLIFFNTDTEQLFFSKPSILSLGQLVRDNNQIYVISQRSIDGHIKNGNKYYNVIYTLSRNRIARSENIVADSSVISYKTPDDNLVSRSQLYKDYIELSLQNINNDEPYLSMNKALVFSEDLAGTDFDFTVLASNTFGVTFIRYVKNPTVFDLHKSKLINVDWQDNNVLGFRFDRASGIFTNTLIQTPILYTDDVGKSTNFELLFLDTNNINTARNSFNAAFPGKASGLIPFEDLTRVDFDFYTIVTLQLNFLIRIQEPFYDKDPFEIPVFEYMIQGNDDYNPLGNIILGNDLFSTFQGDIRYHYIINNSTRFTAENSTKVQLENNWSAFYDRRVVFNKTTNNQYDLDLFNVFDTETRNDITIKNIGFYAVNDVTNESKFLFAINDYAPVSGGINDKSNIRVFINNWKI
jgi:hypothetical protein